MAFCGERIAHDRIPRQIRAASELPLIVTGKVQKFAVRKRIEAELAGGRHC